MVIPVSLGWSVNNNNRDRKLYLDSRFQSFPDLGIASTNFFNGKTVSFANIKNCVCSKHGVFNCENELILEATILGLYPRMQYTKEEEVYIRDVNSLERSYELSETIEEAAYCMNAWDHNYQHFIIETLPKIHLAYLKTNCEIIVTDNDFVREIVSTAYPNRTFRFLKLNSIVKVRNLYLPMPVAQNFEQVLPLQIFALLNLREKLAFPTQQTTDKMYLARLNVKGMAGQFRRMTNDSDVLDFFKRNNVVIDDFSNKTLPEKVELSSRFKYIYTPIGANLINFIFTQNEINLYVISHPYFNSHAYFVALFEAMRLPIKYHVIPAGMEAFGDDNWLGQLNSPYRVDMNILAAHFNLKEG